jgi:tetratricopeptide (TPR) repeat protein
MPEVSEPESCRCGSCGAKSSWIQGFVTTRRAIGRSRTECVTCWLYRRRYRGFYGRLALWACVLLLAGYYFGESVALAVPYALALYAAWYSAVVVHELGHASTAIALGFRVTALSLGGGLRTKILSWRNTFVLLSPSPVEGLVLLRPSSPRHYRKKMALILAAGPLANFLCGALTFAVLDAGWFATVAAVQSVAPLWIGVNLALVLNLLPIVSRSAFGPLQSDGLQLWVLPKLSDQEIERRIGGTRLNEAHLAFQYGAFERAHAVLEATVVLSGELRRKARALTTAVLISMGRTREGIELARRSLGENEVTPDERALLMNNLAWALVDPAAGELTPANLAEADELSARAMETLPMANGVRGTRGAVLVEKGAYREAVELLSDKRFRLEARWSRATVKATLALALAGLGNTAAAAAALRAAAALDPRSAHVERARERIARAVDGTVCPAIEA